MSSRVEMEIGRRKKKKDRGKRTLTTSCRKGGARLPLYAHLCTSRVLDAIAPLSFSLVTTRLSAAILFA